MTAYIASKVGKHILKENVANRFGTEDPYFDYLTPNNTTSKTKTIKTKKTPPPGLTPLELKVLKKVTRRAYRLDNCFSLCGIRIGWGAIFGFIPGLGDVFDAFMAIMVYRSICALDIPATLKSKMMANILLDFAIGLVPVLGDVADALFKANTRNVGLLYTHLRERGVERGGKGGDVEAGMITMDGGLQGQGQGQGQQYQSKQQSAVMAPVSQQQQRSNGLTSPPPVMTVDNNSITTSNPKANYLSGQTTGTTNIIQPAPAAQLSNTTTQPPKSGFFSRFNEDRKEGSVLKKKTATSADL